MLSAQSLLPSFRNGLAGTLMPHGQTLVTTCGMDKEDNMQEIINQHGGNPLLASSASNLHLSHILAPPSTPSSAARRVPGPLATTWPSTGCICIPSRLDRVHNLCRCRSVRRMVTAECQVPFPMLTCTRDNFPVVRRVSPPRLPTRDVKLIHYFHGLDTQGGKRRRRGATWW